MTKNNVMTQSRPNILIFHCDQLRYDALGCTGHPGNPTPNIDALAAKGLSFTRHFAANPVCMPSRASFFTGMPVTAHGVWSNGVPLNRREYLPFGHFKNDPTIGSIPELPTFADLLSQGGYATGAFGKLHLTPSVDVTGYEFPESDRRWASGEQDDWHGPYYGFQHVELTHAHAECPGGHYEVWLRDTHPELYEQVRMNQEAAVRPIAELGDLHASVLTYDTHPSPWIARRALEWIHDQGNQPFCAFLGFPDPHHAFCALQEDIDYFNGSETAAPVDADGADRPDMDGCGMDVRHFTPEQHDLVRRTTAAMVRTIDRAVGEVIEGLKAEGKWENTVVLFTSDHGDYLGDHGRLRKSHRAAEQLLHVPCILRLPGESKPMSRASTLPRATPTSSRRCCNWPESAYRTMSREATCSQAATGPVTPLPTDLTARRRGRISASWTSGTGTHCIRTPDTRSCAITGKTSASPETWQRIPPFRRSLSVFMRPSRRPN
jgi:arylsulfatase A-like enzyme